MLKGAAEIKLPDPNKETRPAHYSRRSILRNSALFSLPEPQVHRRSVFLPPPLTSSRGSASSSRVPGSLPPTQPPEVTSEELQTNPPASGTLHLQKINFPQLRRVADTASCAGGGVSVTEAAAIPATPITLTAKRSSPMFHLIPRTCSYLRKLSSWT
jgi:hypothetical protein